MEDHLDLVMNKAAPAEQVRRLLDEHVEVARAAYGLAPRIAEAARALSLSLASGGKIILCGNGGSAADAQHIAGELTGRFLRERKPLAALALHANSSTLTAIGNDYGYEEVFARPLAAIGRAGDVLVAISTSGGSPNVLRAVAVAKGMAMTVVALTGQAESPLSRVADICLAAPSASTPRIQEMHILFGHILCQLIEDSLPGPG